MGSRKGAKNQRIDETGDRKIDEEEEEEEEEGVGHGRSSTPSSRFISTARGRIQSLQKANDEWRMTKTKTKTKMKMKMKMKHQRFANKEMEE